MSLRETAPGSVNAGPSATLITVHGTGDTNLGTEDCAKWWEPRAPFCARLQERLAERYASLEIVPFRWSGANSEDQRQLAAHDLARLITRTNRQKRDIHIIAHSHGGNVVECALNALAWRRRRSRAAHVKSVTSVGTPFFARKLSRLSKAALMLFSFITLLYVVSFGLSLAVMIFDLPVPGAEQAQVYDLSSEQTVEGYLTVVSSYLPILMLSAFFVYRFSLFAPRPEQDGEAAAPWACIMHPGDEAFVALSSFMGGDIPQWREVNWQAYVEQVAAVIAVVLWLGATLFVTGQGLIGQDLSKIVHMPQHVIMALGAMVIVAAIPFLGVFLAISFASIFRLPQLFVSRVNDTVVQQLRCVATGQDTYIKLQSVHERPTLFSATERSLAPEDAASMTEAARSNIQALVAKNHQLLFQVASPLTQRNLLHAFDANGVWQTLVHTRYFDVPSTIDICAEHIAQNASLLPVAEPAAPVATWEDGGKGLAASPSGL